MNSPVTTKVRYLPAENNGLQVSVVTRQPCSKPWFDVAVNIREIVGQAVEDGLLVGVRRFARIEVSPIRLLWAKDLLNETKQ